jgi:hypothetical protein
MVHSRLIVEWLLEAVVPGYSGGTATELHRLPYSPNHPIRRTARHLFDARNLTQPAARSSGSN